MGSSKVELLRAFGLWLLFLTSVGFTVAAIMGNGWQWFVSAVVIFIAMVVAWVATG